MGVFAYPFENRFEEINLNEFKSLIDIGAGTGVYSLHLAKLCQSVLALDLSPAMLEILQNSANEYNISNINKNNILQFLSRK
mgnify:CR=1 FL=1